MPTPRTTLRIWWDKDAAVYYVEAPYNPAFIAGLKAVIPYGDGTNRAFNQETKLWAVGEQWFPALRIVGERLFPGACSFLTKEQVERQQAVAPAAKKATLDQVLLEFAKMLPAEALQSAYRKAAVAFHPDRGGSPELMSKLNMLWQRIEAEKLTK